MQKSTRASIWATLSLILATVAFLPAKAMDEYVIVAPKCSPESPNLCTDKAERARMESEKKRRDAQREALARAAEAARLQREADIKGIMKSLNLSLGQEADAQRLYDMRQAAQAAMPKLPDSPNLCPNRKEYEEEVLEKSQRLPTRDAAISAIMAKGSVSKTQCNRNDFGWECTGQRKTGVKKFACVGGSSQ